MKYIILAVVLALSGCANYDWSFNKQTQLTSH